MSFLEKQSDEYQACLEKLRNVTATLEHQHSIQTSRSIPKQYQPKLLKTFKPTLTEEFRQNYNQLFLRQLERAITSNTIELRLLESRLASILTQTEQHLSTLSLPHEGIKILYNKFLLENDIQNYNTRLDRTNLSPLHLHVSPTTREEGQRENVQLKLHNQRNKANKNLFYPHASPSPHHHPDSTQLQQYDVLPGRTGTTK